MKIINFTVIPCLKSLLNKKKCQTIRSDPHPRFTPHEKIKLMWNQRSKFSYFCPKCGKPTKDSELIHCENCYSIVKPFKKILGNGVITEVFEIEMSNDYHNKLGLNIYDYKKKRYLKETEIIELSGMDGFVKPEDFVKFFKKYDLRFVKNFYVYRWDYE